MKLSATERVVGSHTVEHIVNAPIQFPCSRVENNNSFCFKNWMHNGRDFSESVQEKIITTVMEIKDMPQQYGTSKCPSNVSFGPKHSDFFHSKNSNNCFKCLASKTDSILGNYNYMGC